MEERRIDKKEVSLPMKENVIPDHTRGQGTTVIPHGHDHEYRDISFRSIVKFGLSIAVLTLFTLLSTWGLFELLAKRSASKDAPVTAVPHARQEPPGPRLQANPGQEMRSFRAVEDTTLHSYGWVDKGTGIVHIPIERAIDIVAERGLPVRREGIVTGGASDSVAASGTAPQAGTGIGRSEGAQGGGDTANTRMVPTEQGPTRPPAR